METEDRFVISSTPYGFRHFIKHSLFRVKEVVSYFECEYMHPNISPEKYAKAKRLMELYEIFHSQLTKEETDALEYLHWHTRNKEEPKDYYFFQQ